MHSELTTPFRIYVLLATLMALSSPEFAHGQPAFFMGLGDLPGGEYRSEAYDISGDGSIIVGSSRVGTGSATREGFRWTLATGMVGLGTQIPSDISKDGSTMIGYEKALNTSYRSRADTGLNVFSTGNSAVGVSADGSIVAFFDGKIWKDGVGLVTLTTEPVRVTAISDDGTAITGWGHVPNVPSGDGFVWTQQNGFTPLGPPDGTMIWTPNDFSSDGKTIVGFANNHTTENGGAAKWSSQTGLVLLGLLPDGTMPPGGAFAISGDGSEIVGWGNWIWRKDKGLEFLTSVLANEFGLGSQINGWIFSYGSSISNDGRTITGNGINPAGNQEAWVAFLGSPVPEPSVILLAAPTLALVALRRRASSCRSSR